jgi:uncharacterized protein DUF2752
VRTFRSPPRSLSRTAAPLTALAAMVGAFGFVGAVDPHEPGRYPPCPVAAVTGLYCPGCGGLRSAYALAHGDPGAAIGSNALAVAGFVLLGAALVAWLLRAAGGERPTAASARGWRLTGGAVPAAVLALTAAFTLVRNLPPGAALAP